VLEVRSTADMPEAGTLSEYGRCDALPRAAAWITFRKHPDSQVEALGSVPEYVAYFPISLSFHFECRIASTDCGLDLS